MSEKATEQQAQGMDPKAEVFKGAAAIIYAATTPIDGAYVEQSRFAAICADMASSSGSMRDKRVLDIGCGFGTTALAIARHCPKEILSIDSSEQHIALLQTILQSDVDLRSYLKQKGADVILGEYFEPTLRTFEDMRAEFAGGLFNRLHGKLKAGVGSSLELDPAKLGKFDVVVGNNFLHWPYNQRLRMYREKRADGAFAHHKAFEDAIIPLRDVLERQGVLVLLEPKDFVRLDDDPQLDYEIEETSQVNHPVVIAVNVELNRLLKERHGIERKVTTTSPIFMHSTLAANLQRCGLLLDGFKLIEATFHCNPLDWAFVRLPMWLGQVDLPFGTKMELASEVRKQLRASLPPEALRKPIRGYYFVFVIRHN